MPFEIDTVALGLFFTMRWEDFRFRGGIQELWDLTGCWGHIKGMGTSGVRDVRR